ncbi:unnamed protein product [Spirodela intermedia]|uniref:Uncharacterized protein n=1 Tax=Spirodela intermedia TaxID=51605 RepID=A0A7I8KHN8_SPIIN|nr:unnamed protein product [Spirodela intermedia]
MEEPPPAPAMYVVMVGEVIVGDGDGGGALDDVDEAVHAVGHGDMEMPSPSLRAVDDNVLHELQRDSRAVGDVHVGASAVDGLVDDHVPGEDDPQWLRLNGGVAESARSGYLPARPPFAFLPNPSAHLASCFLLVAQSSLHRQHRSMGFVARHFPVYLRSSLLTYSWTFSLAWAARAAARASSARAFHESSQSAMWAYAGVAATRTKKTKKKKKARKKESKGRARTTSMAVPLYNSPLLGPLCGSGGDG